MTGIRHYGIAVSDIQASLDFYCGLLGLNLIDQTTEKGTFISEISHLEEVQVIMAMLQADDGEKLELLQYVTPEPKQAHLGLNRIGCAHIAFTIKDLRQKYRELLSAGINFHCVPAKTPNGEALITFCQDWDGNKIELIEKLR